MTNAGIPALPARRDGTVPRTPAAHARREIFAARHPEIIMTTRREAGRIVFHVAEPGRPPADYDDPDAMMDELEARHPAPRDAP